MDQRPSDPWPRGLGHVLLAVPGSLEVDKAFHEPGGSFSPGEASFGVSLWVLDSSGAPEATSDNIPLAQLRQRWMWLANNPVPAIATETPYYRAVWSIREPRRWMLEVDGTSGKRLVLVVRSVGPAGGPLYSLDWDGGRLRLNGRWTLEVAPQPSVVYVGHEGPPSWTRAASAARHASAADGWGYARLELAGRGSYTLTIRDEATFPPNPLEWSTLLPTVEIDLPDSRFADCFRASAAHLMMNTVGLETRVGDTTHYPLNWMRDGSITLTALAHAGQWNVARQLSRQFAEQDFFGGFGPEADAPGMALTALEEVAVRIQDPEYDRYLWPHVQRKVQIIHDMLSAEHPTYRPAFSPIVLEHRNRPDITLVCDPAREGLIVGRMDFHRPILYVNAYTYRGLVSAAEIAGRLGENATADRWLARAEQLRRAWIKAFVPPESENDRTYISALWPTWIARTERQALLERLQARWARLRDEKGGFRARPLWTYFDMAEAHQWLWCSRPDRAWNTIQWFWDNQASPGLYTWWEDDKESNVYGRWERVRGWVQPPYMSPDNWTTGEMLMLLADLLAYVDESAAEPELVIGAGIPLEWMSHPMSVKGVSTRGGLVSWTWDTKRMSVSVRGHRCPVRLGSAFRPGTPLEVSFSPL